MIPKIYPGKPRRGSRVLLCSGLLISAALLSWSDSAVSSAPKLRERLKEKISKRSSLVKGLDNCRYCQLAGLKLAVWSPADKDSPAPLVLFSHGFRGSNIQSSFLMKALSDAGYLVIAPNHKDAMREGGFVRPQQALGRPDKWNENTYKDRADDLRKLLGALKNEPSWSSRIDWSKVALVGHSLGGYTVLSVAGAWPCLKSGGISAVVALSPYAHPFSHSGNLSGLNLPVMYQTGTADIGVKPFLKSKNGAFARTSPPCYYVDILDANHFTWTELNHDEKKEALINYYCLSFLNKFLRADPKAMPEAVLNGVSALEVK